ncbi:hypothetical protein [Streptomyces sp. NPDC006193]|uniref:hypothetical protein n=1 Tax=Streptomyces sp. NPDC006193 TaxID=3155717 RepID=UPI0033B45315
MLEELDERFMDMRAVDRGSLMILRGTPGAGKPTFLDTVGFFRQHVSTRRIPVMQMSRRIFVNPWMQTTPLSCSRGVRRWVTFPDLKSNPHEIRQVRAGEAFSCCLAD